MAALAGEGLEYTDFHRVWVSFFAARHCGADSDHLADVTLDRLARQLDEGVRIRDLVAYTRGIARYVYCEYREDQEDFREAVREIEYLSGDGSREPEPKPDLRRRCQKACLRTLSEDRLKLMVDYYLSGRSREELAAERGWTVDNLYARVHYVKSRLRRCEKNCRKKG